MSEISLQKWTHSLYAETYVEEDPYMSDEAKKLINLLKQFQGQLIMVVGDQGTGKTTLMEIVSDSTPETYSFSWGDMRTFALKKEKKIEEYHSFTVLGEGTQKTRTKYREDLKKKFNVTKTFCLICEITIKA